MPCKAPVAVEVRPRIVVDVRGDDPRKEAGPHNAHAFVVLLELKTVGKEQGEGSQVTARARFVLEDMEKVDAAGDSHKRAKHC